MLMEEKYEAIGRILEPRSRTFCGGGEILPDASETVVTSI